MSKKKFPPFKPAKHKWLAAIIRLDSPSGARESPKRITASLNLSLRSA